ncbi:hypothetical protein B0H13DRAFT_2354769 [Mycena leptocephala]|nr:hypothetical protein B0H13DRAFT_2354769 [Mycena leptocephala]
MNCMRRHHFWLQDLVRDADGALVLFGFTVLTMVPSPTVSKCLALGFVTWKCVPIGMNVLFPVAIFAAYQWRVLQIERGLSAGELV